MEDNSSSDSTLKIKLNINYERALETKKFISYGDAIAKLGGLKSSLGPVLSILAPVFVLLFLL